MPSVVARSVSVGPLSLRPIEPSVFSLTRPAAPSILSEEQAQRLLHLSDGMDGDGVLAVVEALEVVLGDDDVLETQFFGLGDAGLDAAHGTHLAAQSHLARHAPSALDGRIDIGREDGGDDAQVHGHVRHAESTRYVEKDILLHEFEAHPFLQHRQQHVEPSLVEARGRPLGRAVGGGGDEGLGLDQKRAHALYGAGDGHSREAVVVVGEKQFRGILHLTKPLLPHLVDADLRGGSEAVFDAAQDTVEVVLVALKLEHRIDDVLQDLRSGEGPLLVDVADEDHGDATRLGEAEQRRGTLAHLRNAARRTLGLLGGDGLYGVDDDDLGFLLLDVVEDGLQRSL